MVPEPKRDGSAIRLTEVVGYSGEHRSFVYSISGAKRDSNGSKMPLIGISGTLDEAAKYITEKTPSPYTINPSAGGHPNRNSGECLWQEHSGRICEVYTRTPTEQDVIKLDSLLNPE